MYVLAPPPPSPAAIYRDSLRKIIMRIVIALLVFEVIFNVVIVAIMVTVLLIDNAPDLLASFSQGIRAPDLSVGEDVDLSIGLASIVGIVLGSLTLFIVRGKRLVTEDLTKVNNRVRVSDLLKMAAIVLGFNAVVSLASLFLELLLQIWGIPLDEMGADIFDPYMTLSGILYVVLLGPIFEEIIFRGAILRSLQPYGENFAIVVSSILFGAYHLILFQGIFAFFVGLVLAYCTLRFSIKWAMALHMLNNGFATAIDLAGADLLLAISIYLVLLAIAFIAGFVGLPAFREQLRYGKPTFAASVIGMPQSRAGQPGQLFPPAQPAQFGQTPEATRPQPFAIAFSSAWLIVALSVAFVISIPMTFLL
jgi:membrane protease YdiL (CAAX protease family)